MNEFTVKIKDRRQDTTHTITERATTQKEANAKALQFMRRSFGHDEFDIAEDRAARNKEADSTGIYSAFHQFTLVEPLDRVVWDKKAKESAQRISERFKSV